MSGELVRIEAGGGDPWRRRKAEGGEGRRVPATYSVRQAARALDVPIRTFRDWITAGKVPTAAPLPGQRGVQIPAVVVEELRALLPVRTAEEGEGRQEAADPPSGSAREAAEGGEIGRIELPPSATALPDPESDVLREDLATARVSLARLEERCQRMDAAGRNLAAALAHERELAAGLRLDVATVRQELAAERERHARETEFLRARVVVGEAAGEQLRILLNQVTRALEALQQPAALRAPESPPRRPWWKLWG